MGEVPKSYSKKRKRPVKQDDQKPESESKLMVDLLDPQKDGKKTTIELLRTPTTEKLLKIGDSRPQWTTDNHLTLPMASIAFPGVMSCLKYGKLPNRLYEVDDPAELDKSDPDVEFKSNLETLFVDTALKAIYRFGYAYKDTIIMRIVVDCFLQRSEYGLGPLFHYAIELHDRGSHKGGALSTLMLSMMIFAGKKLVFKNWKWFSPSFSYLAHAMEKLRDEGILEFAVPQDTVDLHNFILDGWFYGEDEEADRLAACMLAYSERFHYAEKLETPEFSGFQDCDGFFDDFEIDTRPIYDTDSEEEIDNYRPSKKKAEQKRLL
ncbi:hypothetical protein BU16DRAFT_543905 [Lophium mytilinum]|uniref:Uncharacterized protein n=1 Tax=Lophium mytilinum TaxID=390894 RepID=A0A6A6QDV6_9PEZI|nr:hypothetical protein BU16DRAFT_543905 [Lophium mytilinum]